MKFLKGVSSIPEKQWDNLLTNDINSTPFQSKEYFRFYNSVEGFSAKAFAVEEDDIITACAVVVIQKEQGIKSYFSKRGVIFGGPILKDQKSAELLISKITEYFRKELIYLEVRNFNDYSEYNSVYIDNGWEYIPWLNYHLECRNLPQVKNNMSSSRGRGIRKAQKKGATFREAANLEEIKRFYEILADLYKNKIKKPLPAWSFFETFYKEKVGKYFLVYYQEKVIGGIMCPILENKAIYEYYVCGLDFEYRDQKPSVLATWAAIDYALKNDISLFDFMGAGKPDEDYGVRDFKKRFGGEEVEYGRYRKILNPVLYITGKKGLELMQKFNIKY